MRRAKLSSTDAVPDGAAWSGVTRAATNGLWLCLPPFRYGQVGNTHAGVEIT